MRAVLRGIVGVGNQVVDLILPLLHTADVILKRYRLVAITCLGRGKTHQLENTLTVSMIFCRALFEHLAKLFPELLVRLWVFLAKLLDHIERALGKCRLKLIDGWIFLQNLT